MTNEELIAYFETAQLPDKLRLDRATTQLNVAFYVKQYLGMLKENPSAPRSYEMLLKIKNAIETPWIGQEIPTM